MINDLQLAGDSSVTCDAQVCIVGAGTAGLLLARLLRQKGVRVVMLEAGVLAARSSSEMHQHCEQRGIVYHGAELGRSFGLGGTSVLWGGQMIPMAESDFDARPGPGFEAWPITYAEIARYFTVVRQHLGLDTGDSHDEPESSDLLKREFPDIYKLGGGLKLRLSEWLPFKKRNFAIAFKDMLAKDEGLLVWLNAAVTCMARSPVGDGAQIETITAQSSNGRSLHVRASFTVICAGALESTRMLLAFDEATQGSISGQGAPLGRYFGDHLSATCGRFICRDWRSYNLAVAPIFSKGIMRTPRLELEAAAQRELGMTSAFAHMPFLTHGDTGFDVLRNILRRRQGEQQHLEFTRQTMGRVITDIPTMVYWRWRHKRLWIPRGADLLLQVDIEQAPNRESRLYLSPERDALNRKRLIIDWKIHPSDVQTIRTMAEIVNAGWQGSPLSKLADLQLVLPDEIESFSALYDVYHPTGSIRMGNSMRDSVVNKDLQLWGTPNCYVSSTAVFPSAGSANPGITHLALTARLAEKIAQQIRG